MRKCCKENCKIPLSSLSEAIFSLLPHRLTPPVMVTVMALPPVTVMAPPPVTVMAPPPVTITVPKPDRTWDKTKHSYYKGRDGSNAEREVRKGKSRTRED
jgi:hypothetical protein